MQLWHVDDFREFDCDRGIARQPTDANTPMIVPGTKAVQAIVGIGALSTLLQTVSGPAPDLTWVSQVERLGLVGALIIAVVVLWRKLDSKDNILLSTQQSVVRALESNADANRATADAVKENTEITRMLRGEIQDLASARAVVDRERRGGR